MDDFISKFADSMACRAVPTIPSTAIGQPQLSQFLAKATTLLQEPLRQAARRMNPTKSITAAIINLSINGKPNEKVVKAYAKEIRAHGFEVKKP